MQDEIRQSGRSGRAGLHAGKPRTLHVNAGAFPLNVPVGYNVLHATIVVLMAVFLEDERMIRKSNRGPCLSCGLLCGEHCAPVQPRAARGPSPVGTDIREFNGAWWHSSGFAKSMQTHAVSLASPRHKKLRCGNVSRHTATNRVAAAVVASFMQCYRGVEKNPITGQTLRIGTAQKIRTRR